MRRIRFIPCLAALILLAPAAAAAQRPPAIVTGLVTLLDSMRAASNASVWIEASNVRKLTDSTGHYHLVVPSSLFTDGDSVTIVAARVGTLPERRRIRLAAGATVQADFGIKKRRLPDDPACHDGVYVSPFPAELYFKLCRMTDAWRRTLRDPLPPPP